MNTAQIELTVPEIQWFEDHLCPEHSLEQHYGLNCLLLKLSDGFLACVYPSGEMPDDAPKSFLFDFDIDELWILRQNISTQACVGTEFIGIKTLRKIYTTINSLLSAQADDIAYTTIFDEVASKAWRESNADPNPNTDANTNTC